MPSFDLLNEPWIPCAGAGGYGPRSLLEVLEKAPAVRDITAQTPLQTFGLYRFLIAVVNWTAEGGKDWWRSTWEAGCFPQQFIRTLGRKAQTLFDLFSEDRPFLQDPELAGNRKERPIADLALALPAHTRITHFRHVSDSTTALCPACCAFGLLELAPFCPSGGRGNHPSIWRALANAPPVYLLPKGRNVLQTLLLNLPADGTDDQWPPTGPDDKPAWEDDYTEPKDGEIGFLEGLTWRPRQVLLPQPVGRSPAPCSGCGEQARILVRGPIFFKQHPTTKAPERCMWKDPHAAVTRDRRGEVKTVTPSRPERLASDWRTGAQSVYEALCGGGGAAPPVIAQLRALCAADRLGGLPEGVSMEAFSFHIGRADYHYTQSSRWPVPASLLREPELTDRVLEGLTETTAALRRLRSKRPKTEGRGRRARGDIAAAFAAAEPRFEQKAESLFRDFVVGVASERENGVALRKGMIDELRAEARRVFGPARTPADPLGSLEAAVGFDRELHRTFKE